MSRSIFSDGTFSFSLPLFRSMDREEGLEVLEVENEDVKDDDRRDGKLEVRELAGREL